MKTLNLIQGTPEWHAHRANSFNASDAPAMMGASKYTSRTDLLTRMATGIVDDVDPAKQALFDRGHRAEAAVRPLIEKMIGEDLFPITGVSDKHPRLSASFDGITMAEDIGLEVKLWNEDLVAQVRAGELTNMHYVWQLEQQILIADLDYVVFVVAREDASEFEHMKYKAVPGRREALLAGWAQFEADLAAYVPPAAKAEVVAAPVETLPAIVYTIDRGTMALKSNLPDFRAATEALVERTKAPLVTDQDFADREALCKKMREAEAMLKAKADEVVGQINDVATFSRELKDLAEMFRATALASEKLVEAEKKNRRNAIQQGGERALSVHLASLQARFNGRVQMPVVRGDFAGAIKGKRTLDSIQNAVDTELANRKIEANQIADGIDANLRTLDELAADYLFLFSDLQKIVQYAADPFRATVDGRVATHKAQEATKLKAEQERIERETRERLEREAREKAAAEKPAVEAVSTPAPATVSTPAPSAVSTPAPVTTTAPAPAQRRVVETLKTTVATAAETTRPTDDQIIEALALHFRAHESKVIEWLLAMDLDAASNRMAKAI